ncbi:hypothetical protein GCM10029992_48450 [Glycomyces albus]
MTTTAAETGAARTLLRVRDLTVGFTTAQGPVDVVKSLDFDLERGGALGIVGESGSGKSMTSLAIMGLLPKGARRSGSIEFAGTDLTGLPERGCAPSAATASA